MRGCFIREAAESAALPLVITSSHSPLGRQQLIAVFKSIAQDLDAGGGWQITAFSPSTAAVCLQSSFCNSKQHRPWLGGDFIWKIPYWISAHACDIPPSISPSISPSAEMTSFITLLATASVQCQQISVSPRFLVCSFVSGPEATVGWHSGRFVNLGEDTNSLSGWCIQTGNLEKSINQTRSLYTPGHLTKITF